MNIIVGGESYRHEQVYVDERSYAIWPDENVLCNLSRFTRAQDSYQQQHASERTLVRNGTYYLNYI